MLCMCLGHPGISHWPLHHPPPDTLNYNQHPQCKKLWKTGWWISLTAVLLYNIPELLKTPVYNSCGLQCSKVAATTADRNVLTSHKSIKWWWYPAAVSLLVTSNFCLLSGIIPRMSETGLKCINIYNWLIFSWLKITFFSKEDFDYSI